MSFEPPIKEPYAMRGPCQWCEKEGERVTDGYIRPSGGQDVVRCMRCDRQCYNAPKKETGKPQRTFRSRPDLPIGLRGRILELDGYRCFMCGRGSEHGVFLDVAHAISIHDGREAGINLELLNEEGNLFSCCEECNHDTGKLSVNPKLWIRLMLFRNRKACQ